MQHALEQSREEAHAEPYPACIGGVFDPKDEGKVDEDASRDAEQDFLKRIPLPANQHSGSLSNDIAA